MSKFSLYTILGLFICAAGAVALYPYLHQKTTEAIVREGAPGDAPYAQPEAAKSEPDSDQPDETSENETESGSQTFGSVSEPRASKKVPEPLRDECQVEDGTVKCPQYKHRYGPDIRLRGVWKTRWDTSPDEFMIAAAKTGGQVVLFVRMYSEGYYNRWPKIEEASIHDPRNRYGSQVQVESEATNDGKLMREVAVILNQGVYYSLNADGTWVLFEDKMDEPALKVSLDSAVTRQAALLLDSTDE